jgi:hypothetical protein
MTSQVQQPLQAPQIVSWCHPIGTRDGTLSKDAKVINAFMEQTENGMALVKRPGTVPILTVFGAAQGCFNCSGYAYYIIGDTIHHISGGFSLTIPSVTTNGQQYYCVSDVPTGISFIKSASGLWKFTGDPAVVGGTLTKVTDANYPATTVPGIVYLDGILYVMNPIGTVQGSAIDDGMTWPALNFIQADFVLGAGAGIARHLNFLVAYYTKGTQFYYDANAANGQVTQGTQLGPVGNANWTTGLANGDSIVEITDVQYFLATGHTRGVIAATFNGLELSVISTPYVEKILARSTMASVHAFGIRTAGHSFYVVTLVDLNVTLCYDIAANQWYLWSSLVGGTEQYFVGGNYLNGQGRDLIQDMTTGAVLQMDPLTYQDVSGLIPVTAITPLYDYGTINWKRVAAIFFLGDIINTNITVSISDDDYQTWKNWKTIALSTVRKMLQRGGRFRRRAFQMKHMDNTPLRLVDARADLTIMDS